MQFVTVSERVPGAIFETISESDDDLVEVMDSVSDDDNTELNETLELSGLFAAIEPRLMTDFQNDFTIKKVPKNSVFQIRNQRCKDLYIVMTPGMSIMDADTTEIFSNGKIVNPEILMFSQTMCPRELWTCQQDVEFACLSERLFEKWNCIRLHMLRSNYSILSTLSDDILCDLQAEHRWIACNTQCDIADSIAIITHGAVRVNANLNYLFPGSVAGVSEIMNRTECQIIAQKFTGIAVILLVDFQNFMQEPDFLEAINEITYQRSVLSEQMSSETLSEQDDENVQNQPLVQKMTELLVKTVNQSEQVTLNEYTVIAKIGSGATSVIFKCGKDENLFVLKVISRNSKNSIQREISALKLLRHKNIVKLHEIIDCPKSSVVILVLEFAHSGSLQGSILSMELTRAVACSILDAVHYIHSKGFLHLDIKPGNILRTKYGSFKLTDFGTCVSKDAPKKPQGTPAFFSPEMLANDSSKITEASDIYAFGISIYNLYFGTIPFKITPKQTLQEQILYKEIQFPKTDIDENCNLLKEFIQAASEKNIANRLSTEECLSHPWIRTQQKRCSVTSN